MTKSNKVLPNLNGILLVAIIFAMSFSSIAFAQTNPAISVSNDRVMIRKSVNVDYHDITFGQDDMYYMGTGISSINDGTPFHIGGMTKTPNWTLITHCITIKKSGIDPLGFPFMFMGIGSISPQYKLDVDGLIRSTGNLVISDSRYKKEIEPINNFDNLFKINSVKYKSSDEALKEQLELFKQENKNMPEEEFNSTLFNFERQIAERNADTTTHFGFIAQELKELYPNLVYEDKMGYLSVNYTELIPVLVDALKEHNSAIKELKSEIQTLKSMNREASSTIFTDAVLYQNSPNPFDKSTEIKYFMPNDISDASICVYDLTGLQLLKIEIKEKGNSSIFLNANQFKAGMYLYSLIVNGLEVDTKKMIITD